MVPYSPQPDDSERPRPSPTLGGCSGYALPPIVILLIAGTILARTPRSPTGPGGHAGALDAGPAASPIAAVFTPEIQHWGTVLAAWAEGAGLDPNLAATVMQIESCGDPQALSQAGAIGLFQVMPFHFSGTDEPYAPTTNAARGLDYLARSLAAAEGDPRLAFAGYNGGIGTIQRPEWDWPSETVRYVHWSTGIYSDARAGAILSPRLEEWLAAGGASLCRNARQHLQLPP
jgi:hypothetical protein